MKTKKIETKTKQERCRFCHPSISDMPNWHCVVDGLEDDKVKVVTVEQCEPFDDEKKLRKEYEKHRKKILDDTYKAVHILEDEKPMRRLYWSKHGFYADAEYVSTNG